MFPSQGRAAFVLTAWFKPSICRRNSRQLKMWQMLVGRFGLKLSTCFNSSHTTTGCRWHPLVSSPAIALASLPYIAVHYIILCVSQFKIQQHLQHPTPSPQQIKKLEVYYGAGCSAWVTGCQGAKAVA